MGHEGYGNIPWRRPLQNLVRVLLRCVSKPSVFRADAPSCVDAMQALIERFPDGYEGWAKERGEDVNPRPT